jgi:DNA-directed RNA polymerase specialized sigma24 family protein
MDNGVSNDGGNQPPSKEQERAPTEGQGSVTAWIDAHRIGETTDARVVWDRYFARLAGLARVLIRRTKRPAVVADEEDAALEAIDSFCGRLRNGRFPGVAGRHDLSRVLRHITKCKVWALVQREQREKRGGGRVLEEADLPLSDESPRGLDEVAGPGPTPGSALMHAEESRRLLDMLEDETLRQIAVWSLEGRSTNEIARRMGRSETLVRLKLEKIRRAWENIVQPGEHRDES